MKKILWAALSLSLLLAGTVHPGPELSEIDQLPPGSWYGWALLRDHCGPNQVCAEWIQPGSAMDGKFCCISQSDMHSTSFSACEIPLNIRPTGGNPL